MKSRFIEPDSPRWVEALAKIGHDVYHLPGFARLFASEECGEPLAFLAEEGENRLLIPFIVRPIGPAGGGRPRWFEATCPYGYPGPIVARGAGADVDGFLDHALGGLVEEMRRRDIICVFSRLHPLLDLPMGPFRRAGTVVRHGETVSIDLTATPEEIWRGMNATCRNQVRKADRLGQVVRLDSGWRALDTFVDIYRETMARRGAAPSYYFDGNHVRELREALGDHLLLFVAEIGGEVACAALFTEMNGIVNYHLGGTRGAFVRNHPSRTIIHHARIISAERGNRFLHLGGGVGGIQDSLFEFKASFSDVRHPFHTWRVVADEPAYRALALRWQARAGVAPDGNDGFFPAYRKPAGAARPEADVSPRSMALTVDATAP